MTTTVRNKVFCSARGTKSRTHRTHTGPVQRVLARKIGKRWRQQREGQTQPRRKGSWPHDPRVVQARGGCLPAHLHERHSRRGRSNTGTMLSWRSGRVRSPL